MQVRPTRAEILLPNLAHNLSVVRTQARPARLFAVVKADAYGHGLESIADHLIRGGVDGFAVALTEEGLKLRAIGVTHPILVLNGIYDKAHDAVARHHLTPVVYDRLDLEQFGALGVPLGIHLKIDTGMTRLGVLPSELEAFVRAIPPTLRVDGVMTHLSSADDDDEACSAQLNAFDRSCAELARLGIRPQVRHAANSAGTFLRPASRLDLVRVGLALYGGLPSDAPDLDLRPVMRVVTSVARVAEVPAGSAVGYNRTWIARRTSRIATLAIGYGDGVLRALSNRGSVLIHGTRCPVVGNISMDLMGVDVTELAHCERGDEAVLFGPQGDALIRTDEVARNAGTVPYEVMCAVGPRVPRVLVDSA